MRKPREIEFLVDEKGRRKSVLMSYRTYLALIEDLADLQMIAERRDEKTVDLGAIIAQLPAERSRGAR